MSLVRHNFAYFIAILTSICYAQNLVPNPSFEEFLCIPKHYDEAKCLKDWVNPTLRTPDYNRRDSDPNNTEANVPKNYWGNHQPRTGDAYVTMHTWTTNDPDEAENLQIKLKEPLIVGQEYKVKAYIVAAHELSYSNGHAFFFTDHLFDRNRFPKQIYNDSFQIYNDKIISDRVNWTEIGGTFISDKSFNYLTLGCFMLPTDPRFKLRTDFPTVSLKIATYFWDDVSVEPTNRKVDFDYTFLDSCLPVRLRVKSTQLDNMSDWRWVRSSPNNVQSGESAIFSFDKNGEYTVEMNVKVNGKQYTVKKTITVNYPEPTQALFEVSTTKLKENEPIEFKNTSKNANQFSWSFGNNNTSDEKDPSNIYNEMGSYRVQLIAKNDKGCVDTMTQNIFIPCGNRITANAFTPNGDGDNDVFPFDKFAPCNVDKIEIFNRWGVKVWESKNPSVSWDAEGLPNGTYYYSVHFQGSSEGGYIEVVRE
jgi:gliding motility-associated-like protein